MKYIIFTVSFLLFFVGCKSSEPTKPKQWLDCYVRYLTQENQIRAEATLKQGIDEKTASPTEIMGGIQYNNSRMSLIAKQGLTYKFEREGAKEAKRNFEFKSLEGKTILFDLPISEVVDFSFEKNKVTLKKPNILHWTGTPMEPGEKFVLIWENAEFGTVSMQVSGTSSKNSIDFPAAEMDKLKAGKWMLYMVRTKATNEVVDGVTVRGVGEIYSQTKEILVQ
jgi:hypothetical protein